MALPVYEMLLETWKLQQANVPELAHYINVGIEKLQEYVHKSRKSRVYALAMSMSILFSL